MALEAGARLGIYEVAAPLGAGGMGEVYRARDSRLNRDVAIKILPAEFVADRERVARFEREAQLVAALNHPNIAGIYGIEKSGETQFLVLELVEGESLAQRISQGGLAIDEALTIARQIVDALEAAQEKGIVHRDLKPANIMLTPDGRVKVLDFGLAKFEAGGSGADVSNSPTLSFAATQAGVILGTAAYMSPEQAKGRNADKRSDVWAFGCVLYEMLAGKRAFEGEDLSDTLAAVIKSEPDWTALPGNVPAYVRTILKGCLAKDRRARIPDISVVRYAMDGTMTPGPPAAPVEISRRGRGLRVWQAATALFVLATAIGIPATYLLRSTTQPVARFFVLPSDKQIFSVGGRQATTAVISPDGRKLAFTARNPAGKNLLWIRPIDSLSPQSLAGTDGAYFPFWSPDSRFIGFFSNDKLLKIDVTGGPPQTVCTCNGRGATWSREGVIVLNNGQGPLFRVPSAGGQPVSFTRPAAGQQGHVFPSFLPDGRHVLYYGNGRTEETSGVYVASLDTGETKRLVGASSGGVYAAGAGYVLFVRDGTLLAQSFNPKTLTLSAEPFPVAEGVESTVYPGVVAFSVSETGVLAYGIGSGNATGLQMVWVDRQGKVVETVGPPQPQNYRGLDLAPDGKRIAAHRHDGQGGDIWITELSRGTTSRFTFDPSQENSSPIWSPDGSSIVFGAIKDGKWGLYQKPSNGSGNEERLFESDIQVLPTGWAPDGRSIVYWALDPKTQQDLWLLPLSGKPSPLVNAPFNESHGQISPDGKWLAYHSSESGPAELYVRPFPSGAGKWQVSNGGGVFSRWRGDGRELFYMSSASTGKLMAVDVRSNGTTFEAGTPKALFDTGYINLPHAGIYHTYAVSPDGQRFLIPRPPASSAVDTASSPMAVVVNWAAGISK